MNRSPFWTPIIISCLFVILSKMSMNKEILNFFCFCVLVKKLCNCLCRCFSFSSCHHCFWTTPQKCFWYVWFIVVVCNYGSILRHTWGKKCGKCSINLKLFVWEYYMSCALEKIMMAEWSCSIWKTIYEEVIFDTYDPSYVVSVSLFTVNTYHSVQRV